SMVEFGDADALISGLTRNYASAIRPALQVIGAKEGSRLAGMYLMLTAKGPLFLADTTVNTDPTAQELAEITVLIENHVRRFNITPRIAMLSYSNFGSNDGTTAIKVREAVKILHRDYPEITVDGELQANFALDKD